MYKEDLISQIKKLQKDIIDLFDDLENEEEDIMDNYVIETAVEDCHNLGEPVCIWEYKHLKVFINLWE